MRAVVAVASLYSCEWILGSFFTRSITVPFAAKVALRLNFYAGAVSAASSLPRLRLAPI